MMHLISSYFQHTRTHTHTPHTLFGHAVAEGDWCPWLLYLKNATGAAAAFLFPSVIGWRRGTLYFLKPSVDQEEKEKILHVLI